MKPNGTSQLWSQNVSPELTKFFENFYRLLDGRTPEEAQAWSETFVPDGKVEAFGQVFEGYTGTDCRSPSIHPDIF
jgi:hypothetical protein